jgi:GNAT acetyltransferase-like protein/regulatory LuxR family protein
MPLPLLTDRLLLRAMTLDDVPALHRIWSDAETMRFISAGASRDLAHTRERVQWQIDAQDRNGYSLYAVAERATAAAVGDCGLLRMDDGGVEVGYRFDRAVWGRGLATEAVGAVVDQEVQVAHLAAGGQTNPEIGAQLFLSPRTVEWHLSKVSGKLGINSRKELGAVRGRRSHRCRVAVTGS